MKPILKYSFYFIFLFAITACDKGPVDYPELPRTRGSVDLISELKEPNSSSSDIHPKIEGLYKFMMVMENQGVSVDGSDIKGAIDYFNPKFSSKNEEFYRGLNQINTVFNRDGKLYLTTKSDKTLEIDKMKIRSGSRLIKSSSTADKVKFKVEDGISVGWRFIQFDLNYVELDLVAGEITFNYGDNKSEKVKVSDIVA